ncbi:MAG: hypothetical protein PHW73_01795 [Atribacterota bacterium]|nr:hypothetical protein [Atribacterota bacterium]
MRLEILCYALGCMVWLEIEIINKFSIWFISDKEDKWEHSIGIRLGNKIWEKRW